MPAFTLALALALPAPVDSPEHAAWDACLLSYAQIEAFGTKTEVRIVTEALAACGPERQLYEKALIRQFDKTAKRDNTAIDQAVAQIEADRKTAIRRVIAFVQHNRQG